MVELAIKPKHAPHLEWQQIIKISINLEVVIRVLDKIRLVILLKIVFKPRNIEISSLILVINLRILMSGIPDPVIQVEEVAIKNHPKEMGAEIMTVTGQTMVEEAMDTEQGAVLEDIKTRQNTEVKTIEGGFSRTMIVLLQIGVRVIMADTRNVVAEIAIKMTSEAKMEELTVVTNGVTMLCLRGIIGGMVTIMAVEVIKKSSEISMILEEMGMLENINGMIVMMMVVIGVFNQAILLENVLMKI